MARKNYPTRVSNRRKTNGPHIIVTRKNADGSTTKVKSFATPKEMLSDIILNTQNYPAGNYGYLNG